MEPEKNHIRKIQAKLKWVESEFVQPAFDDWVRRRKPPMTMDDFDMFVRQLFTSQSKVQVLRHGCSISFPDRAALYVMHLGYIDDNDTIIFAKNPICRTYNMDILE